MNAQAILIAGPTASGKSAMALRLAAEHNGVIINADSMQVYADLHLLTARPDPGDLTICQHLLYGVVAASDPYSTGRWLRDAAAAIVRVQAEGRMPVIVGGTGLYFLALLEGLSPIPDIPADIRRRWRDTAAAAPAGEMQRQLALRDPESASRLAAGDTQRLTRAFEVLEATGKTLSHWQRQPGVPVLDAGKCERLVVAPPRDVLAARADQRFDAMMEGGALAEVQRLAALKLSPELPIMRALGVRPLLQLLAGELSEVAAVAQAKLETRQYQKRQLTWIKRQMSAWTMSVL
jgi:tRNA dimethylallyltransferase